MFELNRYFEDNAQKEGDKKLNNYLIHLGKTELQRMRQLAARGQLDGAGTIRKQQLEKSVGPILALEISGGEFTQEKLWKFHSYSSDISRSQAVFVALGQEKILNLAYENVAESLKDKLESSRLNTFSLSTPLTETSVAKIIGLTETQKLKLSELSEEYSEKSKYGSEDIFQQLENLLESHWTNLLSILAAQQRESAVKLIGEPIQWFRAVRPPKIRNRDFANNGTVVTPGQYSSLQTKDGRTVHQMTVQELRNRKIEFLDSHNYEILKHPFIWNELELSTDQKRNLKKLSSVLTRSDNHQARLGELLVQDKVEYPSSLKEILTKDQLGWFRHIELQVLTGAFESSVGLLHPEIQKHLKLAKAQSNQIDKISNSFSLRYKDLYGKLSQKRKEIASEYAIKVRDVLTKEQLKKFEKLFGKVE